MGWRFRKSFKMFPGVRLNLSRSGLSFSLGGAPMTLNLGPRGPRATLGIPGSGVSWSTSLLDGSTAPSTVAKPQPHASLDAPPAPTSILGSGMYEIRSLSPDLIGRGSMDGFRQLIADAWRESVAIDAEVRQLDPVEAKLRRRSESWSRGWLFKRLFPKRAERIHRTAVETTARLTELKEQRDLCRVQTEIDVPADLLAPYQAMVDAFRRMAGSSAVWDTVASRATNRVSERTTASVQVARERVVFEFAKCAIIGFPEPVPCLRNRNGGDLFLFPGFVLMHASGDAFAVLDLKEVTVGASMTRFIEDEHVPADAQVVGCSWRYSNKDGSPDRRFRDNVQIPVASYGALTVDSSTGVHEAWLVSNVDATLAFGSAWVQLLMAIQEAPA